MPTVIQILGLRLLRYTALVMQNVLPYNVLRLDKPCQQGTKARSLFRLI